MKTKLLLLLLSLSLCLGMSSCQTIPPPGPPGHYYKHVPPKKHKKPKKPKRHKKRHRDAHWAPVPPPAPHHLDAPEGPALPPPHGGPRA